MKILALTSSTGGGHDMRAHSLRAWAQKTNRAEVVVYQTLENTHGLYRFGVGLYNWIQKHAPVLHHIYFHYLEYAGMFRRPEWILGKANFLNVLKTEKPDVIVSTHASLNHGFFEMARAALPKVRCVTYCGELFGGYGFSRHWVNPHADGFIGAVDETCETAVSLRMNRRKICNGGFLLKPEFWNKIEPGDREDFIRNELRFDPGKFLLVLGTGAVGANNHLPFLEAISKTNLDVQVLALCGVSQKTMDKINAWKRRHRASWVRTLGYTHKMPQILQSASAILARPGTGTTSEAILSGCPLIFNGMGGVMPQECLTVAFAKKHGFAHVVRQPEDLVRVLNDWLASPEKLGEVRAKMTALRPARTPKEILDYLVGLTRHNKSQ